MGERAAATLASDGTEGGAGDSAGGGGGGAIAVGRSGGGEAEVEVLRGFRAASCDRI